MKKALYFFGLCAYAVGTVGGFGYAMASGAYFIAACVLALAAFAFPTIRNFFKKLTE